MDVIVIHAQDGMSASAWRHCSGLSLTPDHLKKINHSRNGDDSKSLLGLLSSH